MRTILWDFEGTLADRPGRWAGAMVEVLDEEQPGHGIRSTVLRQHLYGLMPFDRPDRVHPELCDPRAWWLRVQAAFRAAYVEAGCPAPLADRCAPRVRERWLRPRSWQVRPEAVDVLQQLRGTGWRHVIVDNQAPELPALVASLGLAEHVAATVTSARVGAEKPNPAIFTFALELAGRPSEVWMVGDDDEIDIRGASALGIPGILVRREGRARRRAGNLREVAAQLAREGAG